MVSDDLLGFIEMTKYISNMYKSTDRENIIFLKIRTYAVKKGDSNFHITWSIPDTNNAMKKGFI